MIERTSSTPDLVIVPENIEIDQSPRTTSLSLKDVLMTEDDFEDNAESEIRRRNR